MKTAIKLFKLSFVIFLLISCKTEDLILKALEEIPQTKYYSTDIIPDQYSNIYGTWKMADTSGGIIGKGYKKDFDKLVLKKNGIFGIVRNDSLISYGKLTLLPIIDMGIQYKLFCRFDFEKMVNIQLYHDVEKYIQLITKDSLNLVAPCCDRYNFHLVRVK